MPWTAAYLPDGVYTAFSGHTMGGEILAAVREFFAHSYEHGPRFALFDLTDVTEFDVDAVDIDRIVMEDRRAAQTIHDMAIAVVAPEAVQYGIARMWELRLEPTEWRTKVVTSLAEALLWLGEEGIDAGRLTVPHG